jgi:hypothetical protein
MDEKPKSIWKKTWSGWRAFLLFAVSGFAVVLAIGIAAGVKSPATGLAVLIVGVALLVWLLVAAIRWATRPRNFKRLLFGLACFATLIALFYAEENWRGKRAWSQFKHEWEAKGERFDLASVTPPAVPDDQNFALTPIVATSYEWTMDRHGRKLASNNTNIVNRLDFYLGDISRQTNGIGQWPKSTTSDLKPLQEYYRTLAATTNLFPVSPQPQSPAADVLLALGKFNATVEELREVGKLPESRFPLEYDADCPTAVLLPHLAALRNTSQLLQLRAIAELQNGESQKALDDVRLSLRLADSVRSEPTLISHLVRIAILKIALQPVYEGLAAQRWSDAQLVELEALLARQNYLADYQTAMRGEMVFFQIGCIQYLRRHPEQLLNLSGPDDGKALASSAIIMRLVPSGWFYQNQYRCVRMTKEFLLSVVDLKQETVSPGLAHESDRRLMAETRQASPYNILERMLMPALGRAVKNFAYAQSSVDLARTAIALERYRLAHGEYPESLDALAPQFIAKVPHDVIGGQPLKYRREANGLFTLYSVGWNETDDGGVVVFKESSPDRVDVDKGDWVWRYPQK